MKINKKTLPTDSKTLSLLVNILVGNFPYSQLSLFKQCIKLVKRNYVLISPRRVGVNEHHTITWNV